MDKLKKFFSIVVAPIAVGGLIIVVIDCLLKFLSSIGVNINIILNYLILGILSWLLGNVIINRSIKVNMNVNCETPNFKKDIEEEQKSE